MVSRSMKLSIPRLIGNYPLSVCKVPYLVDVFTGKRKMACTSSRMKKPNTVTCIKWRTKS